MKGNEGMKRRIVLAALAVMMSTVAADKPDFTGTWKLDASKSEVWPDAGAGEDGAGDRA